MGYEKLSDVAVVKLGGINKKTGKKNPLELEGYFLRTELRESKFKDSLQEFYVFQTANGDVGLYETGGLKREMKKARPGRMTKVVNTEQTKDTGKGNPMIVYAAFQDKDNSIDVSSQNDSIVESQSDEPIDDSDDEEESYSPPPVRSAAPTPVRASTTDVRARAQALMSGRSS